MILAIPFPNSTSSSFSLEFGNRAAPRGQILSSEYITDTGFDETAFFVGGRVSLAVLVNSSLY